MGIKIWLDDIRPMPKDFDIWCHDALEIKLYLNDDIDFVSFDHDLGVGLTGYDVAKLIESMAYYGTIKPFKWAIHSANPVGRKNIEQAMKSAERFFKENLNK